MSGMVGGFGAAAATGKLLKLDVGRLRQAFGIAATYSSGLREMFGTMSKSLHIGKASMSGLYSGLLAKAGFTSSENVLEAPRGFFAVNAGEKYTEDVVAGLGGSFEILNNAFKPYSSGLVTHPTIDAIINLRNREGIRHQDIDKIEAEVNKLVPDLTGKKSPVTGLDGKFSIYHCIAAAMVDGTCGPEQFTDKRVKDPDILSIRKRVSINVNPNFRECEALVRLTLKNARTLAEHIPFASGTPNNPLSDARLIRKYKTMAEKVLGSKKARKLAEKTWVVDELTDFQEIIHLTAPN
jgi:2-methylcitrate dehydratase PrpD